MWSTVHITLVSSDVWPFHSLSRWLQRCQLQSTAFPSTTMGTLLLLDAPMDYFDCLVCILTCLLYWIYLVYTSDQVAAKGQASIQTNTSCVFKDRFDAEFLLMMCVCRCTSQWAVAGVASTPRAGATGSVQCGRDQHIQCWRGWNCELRAISTTLLTPKLLIVHYISYMYSLLTYQQSRNSMYW